MNKSILALFFGLSLSCFPAEQSKSKINEECLEHLEDDCSKSEREYFDRILKKEGLEFIGNYKFLELYELPTISRTNQTIELRATLAIHNGFIWDYTFQLYLINVDDFILNCYRQRKDHSIVQIEEENKKEEIFDWLINIMSQETMINRDYSEKFKEIIDLIKLMKPTKVKKSCRCIIS